MFRDRTTPPHRRRVRRILAGLAAVAMVAGCAGADDDPSSGTGSDTGLRSETDGDAGNDDTGGNTDDGEHTDSEAPVAVEAASEIDLGGIGSLASDEAHDLELTFDDADYDEMLDTYRTTGDKEWIEATVTIDGSTYERVGIRLKGNSSLSGVSSDDDPADLPWLVKLDKYVDGQDHDGVTDLVVRSNSTETALNEAVALELLDLAGLASQDAIAVAFSVNGSSPVLRLVIDHPDDAWMSEVLDESGALYKAESTGDYSYRGDDPDAYDEVFDQEAGDDNADLAPLIEFLDFVNNSDDATFESELADRLDIEAFATYLAMQDLIENFDDIDGPGNNSYLFYDTESDEFTVVAWDHNLAFGARVGPGGAGDFPAGDGEITRRGDAAGGFPGGDGGRPDVDPGDLAARPEGDAPGGGFGGRGGGFGGPGGRSNALVERFLADDGWAALVEERTEELRTELYESGLAASVLAAWSEIVASTGLVDDATTASDAATIAAVIDAS